MSEFSGRPKILEGVLDEINFSRKEPVKDEIVKKSKKHWEKI